jgi:hypothetical protein
MSTTRNETADERDRERTYTSDDMMDAYLRGKTAGYEQAISERRDSEQ